MKETIKKIATSEWTKCFMGLGVMMSGLVLMLDAMLDIGERRGLNYRIDGILEELDANRKKYEPWGRRAD